MASVRDRTGSCVLHSPDTMQRSTRSNGGKRLHVCDTSSLGRDIPRSVRVKPPLHGGAFEEVLERREEVMEVSTERALLVRVDPSVVAAASNEALEQEFLALRQRLADAAACLLRAANFRKTLLKTQRLHPPGLLILVDENTTDSLSKLALTLQERMDSLTTSAPGSNHGIDDDETESEYSVGDHTVVAEANDTMSKDDRGAFGTGSRPLGGLKDVPSPQHLDVDAQKQLLGGSENAASQHAIVETVPRDDCDTQPSTVPMLACSDPSLRDSIANENAQQPDGNGGEAKAQKVSHPSSSKPLVVSGAYASRVEAFFQRQRGNRPDRPVTGTMRVESTSVSVETYRGELSRSYRRHTAEYSRSRQAGPPIEDWGKPSRTVRAETCLSRGEEPLHGPRFDLVQVKVDELVHMVETKYSGHWRRHTVEIHGRSYTAYPLECLRWIVSEILATQPKTLELVRKIVWLRDRLHNAKHFELTILHRKLTTSSTLQSIVRGLLPHTFAFEVRSGPSLEWTWSAIALLARGHEQWYYDAMYPQFIQVLQRNLCEVADSRDGSSSSTVFSLPALFLVVAMFVHATKRFGSEACVFDLKLVLQGIRTRYRPKDRLLTRYIHLLRDWRPRESVAPPLWTYDFDGTTKRIQTELRWLYAIRPRERTAMKKRKTDGTRLLLF